MYLVVAKGRIAKRSNFSDADQAEELLRPENRKQIPPDYRRRGSNAANGRADVGGYLAACRGEQAPQGGPGGA